MANRSRQAVLRNAQRAGFRDGVAAAMRGGAYRAAPVRIYKSVGSPATDRDARYGDIKHFKRDVSRAKRGVVDR